MNIPLFECKTPQDLLAPIDELQHQITEMRIVPVCRITGILLADLQQEVPLLSSSLPKTTLPELNPIKENSAPIASEVAAYLEPVALCGLDESTKSQTRRALHGIFGAVNAGAHIDATSNIVNLTIHGDRTLGVLNPSTKEWSEIAQTPGTITVIPSQLIGRSLESYMHRVSAKNSGLILQCKFTFPGLGIRVNLPA